MARHIVRRIRSVVMTHRNVVDGVLCLACVRRMLGSDGKVVKQAGASQPVRVVGFKGKQTL